MKINTEAFLNMVLLASGSTLLGFGFNSWMIGLGIFFTGSAYLNPRK